jgi:phosphomannomutase
LDELESIYRTYGLFVSSLVNLTRKGEAGRQGLLALMARLRETPPRRVGDYEVLATRDYNARVRIDARGAKSPLPLPKSNVLIFELEGANRIIARPSGTEPKVKFYFDVRGEVREKESLGEAEGRAKGVMKGIEDAFMALVE